MTNRVYEMSAKEIDRLGVLQRIGAKQLSQVAGAKLLGLSTRQVRSLQRRYRTEGPPGLLSKRRGRPSNNRLAASLKASVVELLRAHYADFGPTLAQEKLAERHGFRLSVESVRQMMVSAGLWRGKRRKVVAVHQMRARRSCLGALVQIDGSSHDWFEGRREKCCLLVFIDDATSRLMELHFTEVESTQGYYTATEHYVKRHGRPVSFYSDRHGIFRINKVEAEKGTGETQLGRALRELDIGLICANSPQAKGRVEKANGTLQDRLIKEMRLRGISDIGGANAYLPEFMEDYNRRFAVTPANPTDVHRHAIPDEAALKLVFSQQHQSYGVKS